MVVKAETPITREKSSNKKKKNRKNKDEEQSPKPKKSNVIAYDETIQQPTIDHTLACIDGLKKVHNSNQKAKNQGSLFDEGERILLQVTGIKLPKDDRKQFLRISLPECSIPEPRDICLIVKDLEKGLKIDHEPTVNHFNELLNEKGVDQITQVISLRELKVEYKQYEAKTSLCQKFDIFLVDDRILRLVPMFLGKAFYRRKRIPTPVNLRSSDLKKEIARAINTVTLPLNHHGTCSMVQIGNTSMESAVICKNLTHVNSVLEKRYPGGWKNIRAQHIKTDSSIAIPIYANTLPTNEVGFVDADIPKKVKRENVTGELSTIPGIEVTVTPSGNIKVVKTADPEWDDEKDEAFVDASDEEQDEKPQENEKDEQKSKKRKKKEKSSKSKKSKSNDSDSDDDINDSEQKYMKKVAREDAEKPNKKNSDSDESDEQENDVSANEEDSEEAINGMTAAQNEDGEDEDESDIEDDSGAEEEESSDAEKASEDDEEMESSEEEDTDETENLSVEKESDSEESEEEKFDDQQELDEKDVIVDNDDDEEDDEGDIVNMDKHLLKKMIQNDDDESEDEKTSVKPKKRSKKERRIMQKQQKAAKGAKSKTKKK